MNFICIKYSGLKFDYIFETNNFIFIPKNIIARREINNILIHEFFSCKYDESAQFYVLCKEQVDCNPILSDISDDLLYKFRFLETIIGLLFSNRLIEDSIIMFKKEADLYKILKIFKNISGRNYESNPILIWKNYIITERLKDIINNAFSILESLNDPKDFSLKYLFCFDMYLKGKFNDNILLIISNLWVSLEVLSTITISNILYEHEKLMKGNQVNNLKAIVECYASKIPENKIICWEKFKEGFAHHVKNKINIHLPIRQKVIKMAEEYLDIEELKIPLRTAEDFNNPNDYELFEEKIREFRQFYDNLSLKKIIDSFFKYRNALFHGGALPEKDINFERQNGYFCLLIERLFFKILSLDLVKFKLWGYLNQYIWIEIGEVTESEYFSKYSSCTDIYISKTYMNPLNREYRLTFDETKDQVINNFYEKREDLFCLINDLNDNHERINILLGNPMIVFLINDEYAINQEFELEGISERKLSFTIQIDESIFGQLFAISIEKKGIIVENRAEEDLLIKFEGFIEHAEYLDRTATQLDFIIIPNYICFSLFR